MLACSLIKHDFCFMGFHIRNIGLSLYFRMSLISSVLLVLKKKSVVDMSLASFCKIVSLERVVDSGKLAS